MSRIGANITLAELEDDPYPALARLRADEPVAWVPALNMWMLTRWDDVAMLNERGDLFTSATEPSWLNTVLGVNMLGSTGHEHRRLKDALQPIFTRSSTGTWVTDQLPRICDELIDNFDASGTDVMTAYAEPIAVRALQDALAWNNASWQEIAGWTRGVCTGLANFGNDPALAAVAASAHHESGASILEGVVPQLLRCGLSGDEIVNNIRLCMSGGINEPRDGIALAVWALLMNPEALAVCSAAEPGDSTPWRLACEETFRWISPVATATRQTTTDVEIHGVTIPAGSMVAGVISSANRDERRWTNGDRFDIHRREGTHMAFSTGAHVCLGAWLGRSTVRVAVQRLFQRRPDLCLQGGVEVRGFEFRGALAVNVRW